MIKQETLYTFFKRTAVKSDLKRSLTSENDSQKKKLKVESKTNSSLTDPAVVERDLIENNRLTALIKKTSKNATALHENIGLSWFKALQPQFSKPYFLQLSEFLTNERKKNTIFPPADKVYSWTHHCEIDKIKVVILGQDPYHQPKQAHGLSFSVEGNVTLPPSLGNIFTELKSDFPGFIPPGHGNLTGWAKQGVLLLNACLTVKASCPNSHKDKGWEQLTDAVISWISTNGNEVVFLLWGEFAKKKQAIINKNKHCVLTSTHPSPFSARNGFFGCRHFSKANEYLLLHGKEAIDWKRL